ncbi:MAG: ABC transporter permease [Longimicrobiales bacterium]
MNLMPVLRSLVRARALALAVVGTLAIGTGAMVTTFLLVDAALWRPPPFPDADRIGLIYFTRAGPRNPYHRERWSFPAITMLRGLTTDIASIANYSGSSLALTGMDEPEWLSGEIVSPAYFSILRAQPQLGRTFLESEDVIGADPVVVLGHGLWQRRFAGDPAVVGRTVHLRGEALTVIGVMRAGFRGLTDKAEYWIPTVMAARLSYAEYLTTDQNFINVVARLHPGITFDGARSTLQPLGARIHAAVPMEDPDTTETVGATARSLAEARVEPNTRRSLLILFSAVALLYLLACANAINLLLGRAATRRREAAILSALGCGPARLVRHFLPEGLLLVSAGSLLGLVLAWVASFFITTPTEVWGPRNFYGSLGAFALPGVDLRVVGFAVALTFFTMLLVAWAPAASAARVDILAGLKEGGRYAASRAGTLRRPTLRGAIVALESGLALLLLVGGGLMIDSFMRMRRTELGVDAERVLTFWLRPNEVQIPAEAAPAFIARMLEAIARAPGVVAATVDGGAPVSGSARSSLFIAGRPTAPEDAPGVLRHYIGPDHFRVLGVNLLRGRVFNAADVAGRPRVAIISETAARRFWPNQDPMGQRVWFGSSSPESSAEIVGIVGDVVHEPLDLTPNRNDFYTPYAQFTYASRMVMVRTTGAPMAVLQDIRRAVRSIDPDLPLVEVKPLTALIGNSWARQRFDAALFGGFATIAMVLAAFGIYAVVSYAVSQRAREMGIRMALGAQPAAILRLVIGEGMGLPAVGLLAGIIGSLALTRFLQGVLYEVRPTDPVVLLGSVAMLAAVSLLACVAPARRATRQDPLVALRAE